MAMQVHIRTNQPQPWQHRVGERCSKRLAGRPVLLDHWGHRQLKRRTVLDRLGMHLESVEPEDRDCPGPGVER